MSQIPAGGVFHRKNVLQILRGIAPRLSGYIRGRLVRRGPFLSGFSGFLENFKKQVAEKRQRAHN